MKYFRSILLCIMMLSLGSITVLASDNDTEIDGVDIDVYVKQTQNVQGVHYGVIENGKSEVITDDGIMIAVENLPEESIRLVIIPINKSEKEVWEWVNGCLPKETYPLHNFYVYFEDKNGNHISANDAVITINCQHCENIPIVYSLDTSGNVSVVSDSLQIENSIVTFSADGNPYYILADKLKNKEDYESPKTGDYSNLTILSVLLMASGICIMSIVFIFKRRNKGLSR